MRESGPSGSHRRILLVMRAAAVLIVATGVNDVIAGAVKSYEPLYVYLGAVALVVWLDGLLLGSVVALTAIALYALLFLPRPAPLPQLYLPLAAFAAVLLVVGAVRAIVVARRRRAAFDPFTITATPLLEPPPPPPPDMSEVLTALADLRTELRSELREELRRERETAPDQTLQTLQLVSEARAQADHERALREQLHTQLSAANQETASAIGRVTDLELAASETERALTDARHKYDLERGRADGEAALRGHLEVELTAERQRTVTAIADRAVLTSRIAELEQALASGQRDVETQIQRHAARIAELEQSIVAERKRAEAAQRARDTQSETDAMRIAELEQSIASERERAEASQRELPRITELEQSLASERKRADAAQRELDEQVQNHVARLAELKQALSSARDRADLSQRDIDTQAQSHAARIAELEQSLASERERGDAAQRDLDTQTQSHAARITELEQSLVSERERADAVVAEFDAKLQTIVNHLAADHETDLGKALEEREEARAEVRSLGKRISSLQKKFDEERHISARLLSETRAAAEAEIGRLRHRIKELEHVPAPVTESRPRVLIAHPDADMRAAARASLERAGYEIVSAADGLEALRTAIAQRPDVVIADAVMPKMDGRELCQLLKSQEKTSHIRVILLARSGDDRPKGELPPDEVLHKPVPLETLKATLANLLGGRASRPLAPGIVPGATS